ncbi:MAG: glucuronate isomerase [Phycisphaerae bacterium]
MELSTIRQQVDRSLTRTPIVDIHTHIYSEAFGDLLLWGIDELLTYHYLVAELFRYRPDLTYADFWAQPKAKQAELIWDELFVRHTPLSEATRGVLTTLRLLEIDVEQRSLDRIRQTYARFSTAEFIDRVFAVADVQMAIMTNDPFNAKEQAVWNAGGQRDPRFRAALRLDRLLNEFPLSLPELNAQGFPAFSRLDRRTITAVRDFLNTWIERMQPAYLAVSLPPSFRMDDDSDRAQLITECVLPVAQETQRPLALMIGVKKRVNPELGDAGDSVGKADVGVLETLCRDFPRVRFLVTMLSRENQHELCVAARKFRNLLPFGCWWFLNNPSIIREIATERFELLGLTAIPQHSDARVLDQLIYKWAHSREIIGDVLAQRYFDLSRAGWTVTEEEIQRDAQTILGGGLLLEQPSV